VQDVGRAGGRADGRHRRGRLPHLSVRVLAYSVSQTSDTGRRAASIPLLQRWHLVEEVRTVRRVPVRHHEHLLRGAARIRRRRHRPQMAAQVRATRG